MLIREHRGNLSDSLATAVTIGDTVDDIKRHIHAKLSEFVSVLVPPEQLELVFGPAHADERAGWKWPVSIMVYVTGYGVFGMINDHPKN